MSRVSVRIACAWTLALVLSFTLPFTTAAEQTPASTTLPRLGAAAGQLPQLRSLLVQHRGTLIAEHYARGVRASTPANIKSASKSLVSAMVGVAIERGLIRSVREPIATWFPELRQDRDPRKQTITVEDLLTMRAGLESTSGRNYGRWVQSANWVRFALARPMVAEPGGAMQYSTGSSHVLSAILTRVSRFEHVGVRSGHPCTPARFHARAMAAGSTGDLLRWQRHAAHTAADGCRGRDVAAARPGERHTGRPRGVGRHVVRPAHALGVRQQPRVRLRLVDSSVRRRHGLLRMGIRRTVHPRLPRSRSRRRRHVVDGRE
ncbi:MAG: serine hydrolase [Vicinamibacterales bacterium]